MEGRIQPAGLAFATCDLLCSKAGEHDSRAISLILIQLYPGHCRPSLTQLMMFLTAVLVSAGAEHSSSRGILSVIYQPTWAPLDLPVDSFAGEDYR